MQGADANEAADPYVAMFQPGAWRELHEEIAEAQPYTLWVTTPPCGHPGQLVTDSGSTHHTVTKNADGSITVEPSIGCRHEGCGWHGHLIEGVWREG